MVPRINKHIINPINASLERKLQLRPINTGSVTEDVWAVRADMVNFFLVRTGDGFVCFDAGYRRVLIREELKKIDIDPLDVSHVFLTHADVDHTRGVSLFPNAEVFISRHEKHRFTENRTLRNIVRSPRVRGKLQLLRDCDTVPVGDTHVRAIETPGHTPGSMSFLVSDRYLFTGDTCKLSGGVAYAGSYYTLDIKRQYESLRKLAQLEGVKYLFTAHSGYSDDFNDAFGTWRRHGDIAEESP